MTTSPALPRPEYPRPQLVRSKWLNLNGEWGFEIDRGDTGLERGLRERELERTILVPFAPETATSGIHDVDFLHAVWYRREVEVPADWDGSTLLLHFGAVDHDATVWVDGAEVARHRGGFTGFTADLGPRRGGETFTVVVRARDTPREPQARGKQARRYENTDCHYFRTTGIWQTVWIEPVAARRIRTLRTTPDLAGGAFDIVVPLAGGSRPGSALTAVLSDADGEVARTTVRADLDLAPRLRLTVPAERQRPWSPSDPHLYDLVVTLEEQDAGGTAVEVDRVESYAGLRSVAIHGDRVLINGEPVFQRLVLDQGLWPDTLMTAPDDAALERDIRIAMEAGFNGARLHQKVFEERFYYHADRLGYLVWGEFGDWGASGYGLPDDHQRPTASFITQWLEALERDHSHPSIVGWCPLNETWQTIGDRITQLDDVTQGMYLATKLADPSRPVLDASGYSHRVRGADIYDSHDYEQDPAGFAANQGGLVDGAPWTNDHEGSAISVPYAGQPYFVSEYGGIWWNAAIAARGEEQDPDRAESWGYGQRVRDAGEWLARFTGLTDALLDEVHMFGYCYTQLTDTFQEENGIFTADREPKFDLGPIAAVQRRRAAIEES